MKVAVANIKCNPKMRQRLVEGDISFLAELAGVFFGSEIEIPRYVRAWTSILRQRAKATTFNSEVEAPVSLRERYWKVLDQRVVLTHHGRRAVTPNRYLSVVRAKRKRRGTPVSFVATHYVSGGWHRGFKAFKAWRRKVWAIHHSTHVAVVEGELAAGFNVVTGGDFNRTGDMKLHPDAVTVVTHGIDHLYAIPAPGYRVVVRHREVIHPRQLHTDHPIIVADFDFVRD